MDAYNLLDSEPSSVREIEEALPMEDIGEPVSGKKRGRKGMAVTPIVDSAVRRSNRVRANSNGFKLDTCKIKNCLGCSSEPPILYPHSLKKIGTSLCQLQEDQLDEHLLMTKNKLEPVGKKVKKNKNVNEEIPEGEEKEKKEDTISDDE